MPVTIQEKLSWVPIQIEILYNQEVLGIGTAFFYLFEETSFLVTNWHNVSGRRPDSLEVIHKDAAIPNKLRLYYPINKSGSDELPEGGSFVGWNTIDLDLYEDDEPIWYEHPTHMHKVDAVAIKLGVEGTRIIPANTKELDFTKITLRPSLDVFVLGYPRGLTGGAKLPIWKRGSIASEPEINLDGFPKFYIDTATREGMSGSPVYAQHNGYCVPEGGSGIKDAIIGEARRFAGIYSGRVGDDTFKAQLGIVWKESAVIEIISGGIKGKSSFEI